MIITKEVEIRVVYKTLEHYKNKGYDAHTNKKIKVKVEDLTEHSHAYISVKCNTCGKIKKMKYLNYNVYVENSIYNCNKCNGEKRKRTCLKKYGVEYVSQVEKIKDKIKETCIEKYGVDNASKSTEIIEKIKNILIEKYEDNPMRIEKFKEKLKQTIIERYGVENPFQSEKIKEKSKKTCIERYGVENPQQNEKIRDKFKKSCIKKYGVSNPQQNEKIKEKSKLTRIKKGIQIPDHKLTEWEKYRRNVKKITNKYKEQLYNNWNGFDFYDNEYIKDNKDHKQKNYPTIDHKISLHNGFINNISPEIIGNLENLCITKKYINSSKNIYLNSKHIK